jgi:hypothetical protein
MAELSGGRQPLYPRVYGCPQPAADTALSGWIMMVAAAKRTPVREVLRTWNYRIPDAYAADTCRHIPPLSAMAITSLVSPRHLAELHWSGRSLLAEPTFAGLTTHSNGRNIHRYCPLCLRQDQIPYLRLSWRVAFQLMCPEHHCGLLEKCPSCGKAVDGARHHHEKLRIGVDALFRLCPHCLADLCAAPVVKPDDHLRDHLLKAQQQLWQLVRQPFFRHPKLGTISSAKVFESFVEKPNNGEFVSAELGTSYRGIDFRRMLVNHFLDATKLFSRHHCLPALGSL